MSQTSRPSLMLYIWRYKNSTAMKEVCLERVTLHHFGYHQTWPHWWPFYLLFELKWISIHCIIQNILKAFVVSVCLSTLLGVSKEWAPFKSNCHNLKHGKWCRKYPITKSLIGVLFNVQGILKWGRQWSPPSIGIFPPHMLTFLQQCICYHETKQYSKFQSDPKSNCFTIDVVLLLYCYMYLILLKLWGVLICNILGLGLL